MQISLNELIKNRSKHLFHFVNFLSISILVCSIAYFLKIERETIKETHTQLAGLIIQEIAIGNYEQSEKIKISFEKVSNLKICIYFNNQNINSTLSCKEANSNPFSTSFRFNEKKLLFIYQKDRKDLASLILYLLIILSLIISSLYLIQQRNMSEILNVIENINHLLQSKEKNYSSLKLKTTEEKILTERINELINLEIDLALKDKKDEIEKNTQTKILQFIHDIRSPINALQVLTSQDFDSNKENIFLVNNAIEQINLISGSILKNTHNKTFIEKIEIVNIIKNLIELKKIEFNKYSDLKLIFESNISEVNLIIDCEKLNRAVSNLINNAIESNEYRGEVKLSLFSAHNEIKLIIEDEGKGFDLEFFNHIGKKGFTTKTNGNGIGLSSTIAFIEQLDGTISFKNNKSNKGAIITIIIPNLNALPTYGEMNILIDNDALTRLTWESLAKNKNIQLKTYSSINSLKSDLEKIDINTYFFIDSELDSGEKGERVAQDLFEKGFKNLFLTTGHSKEKFQHLDFIKNVFDKKPPFF